MVTRPALDSVEAGLDRVKMAIYTRFAEWGLPCPVTGVRLKHSRVHRLIHRLKHSRLHRVGGCSCVGWAEEAQRGRWRHRR